MRDTRSGMWDDTYGLSLWILTGTNPFGFLPHSGTGMTKGAGSILIEFLSYHLRLRVIPFLEGNT